MKNKYLPGILEKTIEDIYLVYINISNAFYNFFLFLKEIIKFYPNRNLRQVDIELFKIYALKDQFQVSMEESLNISSIDDNNNFTYGEATWGSLHKMMKFINPQKSDIFYDLGCGTGRLCFFINIFYGIEAHGIELIPSFVKNAGQIVNKFKLENIYFHEKDWNEVDFSEASIIFIAGTCLDDGSIDKLTKKFKSLKPGSKILSVSVSFQEKNITLIKELRLPFSWGRANVYISEVN